jgi:hypothetical protein
MSAENRIAALESQVRVLRRSLLALAGVIVVGGLLAATSMQNVPEVIKAKKFQVVNDSGQAMVELREPFQGALVIRTEEGKPAVILTASHGGLLDLRDKDGKTRAILAVTAEEGGGLDLHNKDGMTVAVLGSDEDGNGVLNLASKNGESAATVPGSKAPKEVRDR